MNRGFTIFMAVLLISVFLSLGASIAQIAIKEVQLSTSSRASQEAFYVANTGMECALYYDIKENAFDEDEVSTISCDGVEHTVGGNSESEFTVDFSGDPACAAVTVVKSGDDTTIESRGHNTCASGALRLERGLRTTYSFSD